MQLLNAQLNCKFSIQVVKLSHYQLQSNSKVHLHINGVERAKQSKAHQITHTSNDHLLSNISTSKNPFTHLSAVLSSLREFVVNNPHTTQLQQ